MAAPLTAQQLQTYESPHYTVHTNLPRDEAAVFAQHMHRVFENYEKRFGDLRRVEHHPLPLYLFRSQQDYDRYLSRFGVDTTGSGGMFFVNGNDRGLATWTAGRSRSVAFAVLQHEGFHQFAWHYIGTELPVWLNEGLAQYFEDGVLIRGQMTLGLVDADRIERVRNAINSGRAIPLDQVVSLTHEQWARTLAADPDRATLLYAQAWSMVYFMLHVDGGAYQQQMVQYLTLIARGQSNEQAFKSAFGVDDLTRMQNNWRRYALQQQPDPITAAITRLEFFGSALDYMIERDEPMPHSFGDLRRNMQQRRFTLRRSSAGVDVTLTAEDDELFRFKRPNGAWGRFVLLEPARDDLPPRISAVGLHPEPTLIWERSDDGQLVQDIEFR